MLNIKKLMYACMAIIALGNIAMADYTLPAVPKKFQGALGALQRAAEGIPLILRGLATARLAGVNLLSSFFLIMLAETYKRAGQPKEGLDQLTQAARLVEATQERWAEAELHRVRGALLQCVDQPSAAEASYLHALGIARRQNAKLWELRAAMSMARLWRDQGKRQEARELLAPVYGWFTEGFDTLDLKEAKTLLEELSS